MVTALFSYLQGPMDLAFYCNTLYSVPNDSIYGIGNSMICTLQTAVAIFLQAERISFSVLTLLVGQLEASV